jgi:hypothetical protein
VGGEYFELVALKIIADGVAEHFFVVDDEERLFTAFWHWFLPVTLCARSFPRPAGS